MVAKRKAQDAEGTGQDSRSKPLSEKQLAIFGFVRRFTRDRGHPPTVEEIKEACSGLTAPALRYNIVALERIGYLRRVHDGRTARIEPSGPRAKREEALWRMVDEGLAKWSGGRPKGSNRPIAVTSGPPVSDYIIEDRR